MKILNLLRISVSLICFFTCLCNSFAQNKNENQLFDLLDTTSNGTLEPFEALDVLLHIEDEIGPIKKSKLVTFMAELQIEKRDDVENFLRELDRDGDGKVKVVEIDDAMREFAESIDTNRDGLISVDEAIVAKNIGEYTFLTPTEIEDEVEDVFDLLDANDDGVIIPSETREELSWDQIRDSDLDDDQKVTPQEFKSFLQSDNQPARFEVKNNVATMSGVITSETPYRVLQLLIEHPTVRTIEMTNVPGSVDDEANLRAARHIRNFGFTTIVKSNGRVASGGTDFFLAGVDRVVEKGAKLGIHSWGGSGFQGKDLPKDNPQHQLYLKYYREMGIPTDFYWRTLESADVDNIHWMTEAELTKFNIQTDPPAWGKLPVDPAHEKMMDKKTSYRVPEKLVGEARMMMALLDINDDGMLERSELEGDALEMLEELDDNSDGFISANEMANLADQPLVDVSSRLAQIDTFENKHRIVELPQGIHPGINRHFKYYTNVFAPNGKPIHFLAMEKWSRDRILRVRKVLEHFLQDVPGRKWGKKTNLANAMANNHATMVLLNDSRDMDLVLPSVEDVNLQIQDLRANEAPFEGEADYMKHQTRDAAYEEVFHLVHGSGIIFAMRDYDWDIRILAKQAEMIELWDFDEPDMPGNHFEYIICVYDNYLDLWKTHPTLMEGHPIEKGLPDQSFNGEYQADHRQGTDNADPFGFKLVEDFNPQHISYSVELPEEFSGTFSISSDGEMRYSEKAKHLLNVSLRGKHQTDLIGNIQNNRLVGNVADNILTGNGGDDSLFGGPGTDTAVFRGPKSQYTIRRLENLIEVHDSMVNRDGYDVLTGIEKLKFSDQTIKIEN